MVCFGARYALVTGVVGALLLVWLSGAQAAREDFRLILNTGNAEACGVELPTVARATLRIWQRAGMTWLRIRVRHGVPTTFHTVWLRLDGLSPLTKKPVTALANPFDTDVLAEATPMADLAGGPLDGEGDDGSGSNDPDIIVNGFVTDEHGKGEWKMHLDFPVKKGAYQFQEFLDDLARVPIDDTPFTLRIASHCADQVGHGLVPGPHEPWFDWP